MPPSEDTQFDSPYVRIANGLQMTGETAVRVSQPVLQLFAPLLILYIGGGSLLRFLSIWHPSYPFLSITEDIYLLLITFLGGGAVCVFTIGLLFLLIVDGIRTTRDWVATMLAFIGLGTGAAILRFVGTHLAEYVIRFVSRN